MGKLFKGLGIVIGIVVLLLAVAIVVLPMAVDPNDFKEDIVQQVHEQTNRDLKIDGDLDLSVFPWLGVKIEGAELSNAQGFGKDPAISVQHAAVRVKLLPLLDGQVEIDTVELDGVVVNLVRNRAGQSNLDDLIAGNKGNATASAQKHEQQGLGLKGLSIGGIDIKKARVIWDDRQSGNRFEISDFHLHSGAIVPGNPVKLSMGMLLQSKEPTVTAQIGLEGTVELDQSNRQLNVRDLLVTLDAEGPPLPQGKLRAELKSILLMALDGHAFALLDMQLRSGTINLNGDIKGVALNTDAPQISGKITGQLDDAKINGSVVMRGPATTFKLHADTIDLDRYLPVAGAPEGEASSSSGNKQLLPLDVIRDLNLKGTIDIGQLTVNKMPAKNVHMKVEARNGVLSSSQKIGGFSGGSYLGTLNVNATGQTPTLKLTSKLSGVQLEPLLKQLAGEERISGEGNFNADLTTRGNDIDSFKRSLNGKMDFNLLKGAIKGINLAAELRKAKALLAGKSAPVEKGPVQTDFSQISGSETITNGVMHNDDLQALSPFFRVTGSGTADLVREQLDYTVNVYVVETSKGQGGRDLSGLEELQRKKIGVPVHFTGSFAAPKWKVQWDKVLLESQKEKLKSKLEEKLLGDEKKDGEEESSKDKLKKKLLKKLIH